MPSALNDKRGAPRVSGAVNGKEPLTEEDKKTVDMKTTILILSRQLRCHSPRRGKLSIDNRPIGRLSFKNNAAMRPRITPKNYMIKASTPNAAASAGKEIAAPYLIKSIYPIFTS